MKIVQKKIPILSDIKLIFRPKNISFKKAKTGSYRLYLEKNVQIIAAINETIKINPKNNVHIFNSQIVPIQFRVISEKFSTYQLSLYEILETRQQNFIDSVEFKLEKFLHTYFKEYVAITQQLKGKQKKSIPDQWKTLSNNFSRKIYSSCVKFTVADALLEINCIPQTEYDQIVRQDQVQKLKKKSSQNSSYKKSKTLPTMKIDNQNHHAQQKKYHQNDSAATYGIKNTILGEKQKRQVEEELKRFSIRIKETLKSPQNQLFLKSNNHIDENSIVNSIFKIDDQDQIQHKDLPVLHSPKQSKEKIPKIFVKNYRQLQMPQTNSLSLKIGNLSLNSVMYTEKQKQKKAQQKNSMKQILLTSICMTAYILLIVFLMHPIPKV